jgi:hypothetical protein
MLYKPTSNSLTQAFSELKDGDDPKDAPRTAVANLFPRLHPTKLDHEWGDRVSISVFGPAMATFLLHEAEAVMRYFPGLLWLL